MGKPEGKRQLGRPRRRWVDNIRTDLQEVGCGYMDWIGIPDSHPHGITSTKCRINQVVSSDDGHIVAQNT